MVHCQISTYFLIFLKISSNQENLNPVAQKTDNWVNFFAVIKL